MYEMWWDYIATLAGILLKNTEKWEQGTRETDGLCIFQRGTCNQTTERQQRRPWEQYDMSTAEKTMGYYRKTTRLWFFEKKRMEEAWSVFVGMPRVARWSLGVHACGMICKFIKLIMWKKYENWEVYSTIQQIIEREWNECNIELLTSNKGELTKQVDRGIQNNWISKGKLWIHAVSN